MKNKIYLQRKRGDGSCEGCYIYELPNKKYYKIRDKYCMYISDEFCIAGRNKILKRVKPGSEAIK